MRWLRQMLCDSHIRIWNLANNMKKQNKKHQNLKNWKIRVWCSLFNFFHVICKMWTAKHLAQASCTELTLLNFNCTNLLVKSLKHSLSLFWCLVADFFPSNKSLRKTLAISMGPWLTVVPIQPCKTICKIFGLGGTWFMAASSSVIFFWTSSIATSMGVKTI